MKILKSIDTLAEYAEGAYSYKKDIQFAFLLGLWYNKFPEEVADEVKSPLYPHHDIDFSVSFISETGSSWHEVYRKLRSLGWKRIKVERARGNLTYFFVMCNEDLPLSLENLIVKTLVLDITIQTCKQVQVGTREVPIYETKCEDLEEIEETENG